MRVDLPDPGPAELGSEFKYFTPPLKGIVTVITQSGETADTLAALKKAKVYNCPTLAITNVLGSTVTRIADHTVYMRAGPEIVAATKSFIAQLAVLMGLVDLMKGGNRFGAALERANSVIEEVLLLDISRAVEICRPAEHLFYVGRGLFYPIALEGALKMKEIRTSTPRATRPASSSTGRSRFSRARRRSWRSARPATPTRSCSRTSRR